MSLAKTILEFLPEEAKEEMGSQLLNYLKGKWQKKKPTMNEQIENRKLIISRITETGFSKTFPERLDYFAVLLGTVAWTTYLKNRGCIVRNFYCDDYLYFPAPGQELQIYKGTHKETGEPVRALQARSTGFYVFFAFSAEDNKIDLKEMGKQLDAIVREGKHDEAETFVAYLQDKGLSVTGRSAIFRTVDGNRFWFEPLSNKGADRIYLSFKKPTEAQRMLAEDLEEVLDFELIP